MAKRSNKLPAGSQPTKATSNASLGSGSDGQVRDTGSVARDVLYATGRVLLNPIVLTSTLGLSFLELSTKLLSMDAELLIRISDPLHSALKEFYLQLYTLVLSWILFWTEVCRYWLRFFHAERDTKIGILLTRIRNSSTHTALIWLCGVNAGLLLWTMATGLFADGAYVRLYSPDRVVSILGVTIPPLASPVTLERLWVAVSASILVAFPLSEDLRFLRRIGILLSVLLMSAFVVVVTIGLLHVLPHILGDSSKQATLTAFG